MLFLLLCEPAVRVQLLALQSCFQPPDQVLLFLHTHLLLSQFQLQLPLFLSQGHHLHKNSEETWGGAERQSVTMPSYKRHEKYKGKKKKVHSNNTLPLKVDNNNKSIRREGTDLIKVLAE